MMITNAKFVTLYDANNKKIFIEHVGKLEIPQCSIRALHIRKYESAKTRTPRKNYQKPVSQKTMPPRPVSQKLYEARLYNLHPRTNKADIVDLLGLSYESKGPNMKTIKFVKGSVTNNCFIRGSEEIVDFIVNELNDKELDGRVICAVKKITSAERPIF